jgi:chromosomal replication initiator protein
MEKWEIRATPSADDPARHVLLFQGGPSDIAALLKKFGALMGRPEPAKAAGFNLSLVLHKLKPDMRVKLADWLEKSAPAAAPPAAAAPPMPDPEQTRPMPTPTPAAPPPPMPALTPPPMPTLAPPPPMPTLAPPPPMPVLTPPPPLGIPSLVPPPPSDKPALVSLMPEPLATPTPAPAPFPTLSPSPAPTAAFAPVLVSSPTLAAAEEEQEEYPIAVDLRPERTMESLMVGAYNRFAHAAVMSAVTSPGTMYNPLFLYGIPGTGKSHMVNSIGAALSKGLGGAVLLATSGSRLTRSVNAALSRKTMAEIQSRVDNSKALLIDDIHLMAISDANKDALAKIFKSFFDRKAQVVITSLYPPRSLGALEEALKFSFSKGWSVDLKIPSPATQKDIVSAAADRARSGLESAEITLLHDKLSQFGYSDMTLWLNRVVQFRKVREAAGQPSPLPAILSQIYEPTLAAAAEPPKSFPSDFQPPPPPPKAEPTAVIVPKTQDNLGSFVTSLFYGIGSKSAFVPIYRHAVWETYDPSIPFGVPFTIGEICRRGRVTRALIVGPPPDSPLGPRSAELAHATRRILESFGVQMAWIPYAGLELEAHYLNAHLDLARAAPAS